MPEPIITNVSVGEYSFRIIDNMEINDGKIYSRNFKIGGTKYADCVNVSITYDRQTGNPVSAKIPTVVYVPDCSLTTPLQPGGGSIIIIKTLLRHINKIIPNIILFEFEDMSSIECGTEEEKHRKRHRKTGTHAFPTALYYFSIAFNSITWYEKHFNAYFKTPEEHLVYRNKIEQFLTKEKMMSFTDFLYIAKPSEKIKDELKSLYESASSYQGFFDSIKDDKQCSLVRDWIATFMEDCLKDIFFNKGWIIDVTKMDIPTTVPARRPPRNRTQKAGKINTRKKIKSIMKDSSYYCPKGNINLSQILYDVGA